MITWGISANSHDAALAVFTDDGLEFASHSERFSGVKNDAHLNDKLIEYAKQWGEPDEIIWYERPFIKTLRQIRAGQGFKYFGKNNIIVIFDGMVYLFLLGILIIILPMLLPGIILVLLQKPALLFATALESLIHSLSGMRTKKKDLNVSIDKRIHIPWDYGTPRSRRD